MSKKDQPSVKTNQPAPSKTETTKLPQSTEKLGRTVSKPITVKKPG